MNHIFITELQPPYQGEFRGNIYTSTTVTFYQLFALSSTPSHSTTYNDYS